MDKNEQTIQQGSEIQKKETFGVAKQKKNNTGKKVATAVVAGVVLATAIAVPIAIKVNQNNGYTVNIEYRLQGELNGTKSLNLKKGAKVGNIVAEQMAGYVFVGYCSDVNCLQPLDAETEITKDLTVYLHYVAINYSFASIPEGVKITTSAGDVTTNTKLSYGDEITVTYIIPAGHSVGNFKLTGVELISQQADVTEDNGDISRTATYKVVGNGTSAQSVILTAEFEAEANQYTVTLISHNKTENIKVVQGNKLQNITVPTSYEDENNIYYFVGWNKNYNATATDVMEDLSTVEITGDTTFYAIYKSQTKICDVTYQNEAAEKTIIYKLVNDDFVPLGVSDAVHAGDMIKVEYILTDGCELQTFTVTNLEEQQTGANYVIGTAKLGTTITIDFAERQQQTEGLQFTETEGGLAVSGYTGADTEVIIPMQYEGKDVVTIADSAFKNNAKIKSVQIPDTVTSIGNSAFHNCIQLADITIPDSVTSIGSSALYNCVGLTNITIPEKVTTIGNSAFYNCITLTQINFNAIECADLRSNNQVFYEAGTAGEGIVVTFGENATKVPAYLFYVNNLSNVPKIINVVIGNKVTSIGNSAFGSCTELNKVTIGKSITQIGSSAFSGCTGLINMNYLGVLEQWCEINFASIYSNPTCYTKKLIIQGEEIKDVVVPENITGIKNFTFYNCMGITSITIPEKVTSIGNYTFYGCTGLTNVTIPEKVTSIGSSAFYNCTGLSEICFNATECADLTSNNNAFYNVGTLGEGLSVIFGENVTKIPAYLFYANNSSYAPKITSVVMGNQVTSIGNYAFCNCIGLISINIPEKVTSIGNHAFSDCIGLANITIPASVTNIGNYAFYKCKGLTQINYNANSCSDLTNNNYVFGCAGQDGEGLAVTFGENVTKIPAYLFYPDNTYRKSYYTPKITNVVMGNQVTSIGNYAFYNCTGLTDLTIGENVKNFGTYAFGECTALTKIDFNATECADLTSNNTVFYNVGTLGEGLSVIFGENVTKIPAYLFYTSWNSSYAPKTISIVIGTSVTRMGEYSFYGIRNLTQIYFNATNCTDVSSSDRLFDFAGQDGEGIAVTFGDNVTRIPAGLFGNSTISYAPKITSVVVGSDVSIVGNRAFYNCIDLTEVIINGQNLYNLLTYSTSCGNLINYAKNIHVLDSIDTSSNSYLNGSYYKVYQHMERYKTYSIAAYGIDEQGLMYRITSGGLSVVGYNGSNNDVTIPNEYNGLKVVDIADYAFISCRFSTIEITDNITKIGQYAFQNCTNLTSVIIPNNVTYMGQYAFQNCANLTSVIMGDGITNIESGVFNGCTRLTSLTLPSNLITIGDSAFQDCIGLTSLTLPNSVTSLKHQAFYRCSGLTSVIIPSSLTSLDLRAFGSCYKLANMNYLGTLEQWCQIEFSSQANPTEYTKKLIIQGKEIKGDLIIPEGVTKIGSRAFYRCEGLTSVIIPVSVTNVGYEVFDACSNITKIDYMGTVEQWLEVDEGYENSSFEKLYINKVLYNEAMVQYSIGDVILPNGLTKIGSYKFYDKKITSISIPNGVTSIGSHAFSKCTELTMVIIPNCVTNIGSYAFYGCTGLTTVKIGESVTSIESLAFYNCNNLTNIIIESDYAYKNATSTSACGDLLNKATTVKVLKSIVDNTENTNTYLNGTTFTKTEDGDYYVYIKN